MFNIKDVFPIVIQKLVHPVPCCMKIYMSMGQIIHSFYNAIDLEKMEDPINIDGEESLKFKSNSKTMDTDLCLQIAKYFGKQLRKKGIYNYGIDFIQKEGTKEFYIIDVNYDTLTWL